MSRTGFTDASCPHYGKTETICHTFWNCKCAQERLELLWATWKHIIHNFIGNLLYWVILTLLPRFILEEYDMASESFIFYILEG